MPRQIPKHTRVLVTALDYYAPANVAKVVQGTTVLTGTTDLVTIYQLTNGMCAERAV